jgi:hypothetical protein
LISIKHIAYLLNCLLDDHSYELKSGIIDEISSYLDFIDNKIDELVSLVKKFLDATKDKDIQFHVKGSISDCAIHNITLELTHEEKKLLKNIIEGNDIKDKYEKTRLDSFESLAKRFK